MGKVKRKHSAFERRQAIQLFRKVCAWAQAGKDEDDALVVLMAKWAKSILGTRPAGDPTRKVTLTIDDFGESCRAYFRFRSEHLKELTSLLKIPARILFSPKVDQNGNRIRYAKEVSGEHALLVLLYRLASKDPLYRISLMLCLQGSAVCEVFNQMVEHVVSPERRGKGWVEVAIIPHVNAPCHNTPLTATCNVKLGVLEF